MAVGFALIALSLGRVRDLSNADGQRIIGAIRALSGQIKSILDFEPEIAGHAKTVAAAKSLFFVGRVRGYPVAREGAQKFKEISYRHAEAYQTSELKHGPLALIDESLPTVAVVPSDELTERNLAAVQQIKARGGAVLAVTHEAVDFGELDVPRIVVPKTEPELDPILLTVPLQLLAYHAALTLGYDIDKPRNLAKSVTVE
jgi:glucosamine--fructose-6-phosphate aminotransferase (isomerizing)